MAVEHLTVEQTAAIDELFAPWDTEETPGAAVAVIRDGEIIYERGYGMSNLEHVVPITPDSVFHIASISKQFTATCLLLLEADGLLSLDDDAREYLPELPNYGTVITLRQMLHHISGLRDHWFLQKLAGWREDDLITGNDVLEIVSQQRGLNFAPGTEFLYSNSGYSLQATIVQRVTGKTLRQIAQERIFEPLGMANTHFHDDHSEIVPGRTQAYQERVAGGYRISIPVYDTVGTTSLHTTVRDFAKWDGNYVTPTVGTPELIQRLRTPGRLRHGIETAYGLGLVLGPYLGQPAFGHSGGDAGYRAYYLRLPEQKLGVVVMANLPAVKPHLRAREIVDICLGDALAPLSFPSGRQPTESELTRRAGLYRDPRSGDLLALTARDGTLALGFTEPKPLITRTPDVYLFEEDNPASILTFDENGGRVSIRDLATEEPDLRHFQKIERDSPSHADLAAFAGDYWSDELGVGWRILAGSDVITVQRHKFEDETYYPADRDSFARDDARLTFTRTSRGDIDGFFASTIWARNLRFTRINRGREW